MIKNMLSMGKKDLAISKLILTNASDELDYEVAGYHLQQCVEKLLKYYMEVNAIEFGFHHNIIRHCDMLDQNKLYYPLWIKEKASLLNTYETKTRYNGNLVVTKTELEAFHVLADELIIFIEEKTTTKTAPTSILSKIIEKRG